ncbi:MAG TPA: DoxX family protein [Micropepsaceae bacterium]|jgi:putative oxidoreductase|nr:DoxX family protein [Micropepsaceae bacterium]
MAAAVAQSNEDLGKLVVRLTVGILIVFHGLALATGDAGIPNNLVRWGLPADLKWIGFLVEFGGGLGMILGVYARLSGFLLGVFMVIALIMAHVGLMGAQNHLFMVANNPAGNHWDHYFLETQMFYLLGGFAVALLGAGRYGLNIGGSLNN